MRDDGTPSSPDPSIFRRDYRTAMREVSDEALKPVNEVSPQASAREAWERDVTPLTGAVARTGEVRAEKWKAVQLAQEQYNAAKRICDMANDALMAATHKWYRDYGAKADQAAKEARGQ